MFRPHVGCQPSQGRLAVLGSGPSQAVDRRAVSLSLTLPSPLLLRGKLQVIRSALVCESDPKAPVGDGALCSSFPRLI